MTKRKDRKRQSKSLRRGEEITMELLRDYDVQSALLTMTAMMGAYFLAVTNGNYALANEGVQELADSTCELINGFKDAGILVKA